MMLRKRKGLIHCYLQSLALVKLEVLTASVAVVVDIVSIVISMKI